MTSTDKTAIIAWEFLRRSPEYKADVKSLPAYAKSKIEHDFNSFHEQQPSDLAARKWGLFAFAYPERLACKGVPFWSAQPTIDAEIAQHGEPALMPMLSMAGAEISGLLLLNGDLILKVEHEDRSVQMQIKDGRSFNQNSGLVLRLPVALKLPVQLSRSVDLWYIATDSPLKKSLPLIKLIIKSCCSPLMGNWQTNGTTT